MLFGVVAGTLSIRSRTATAAATTTTATTTTTTTVGGLGWLGWLGWLGLLSTSACDPVVCTESYPLWKKFAVGLPVPVVLTMLVAAATLGVVRSVLRGPPRPRLAAVGVAGLSCAIPVAWVMLGPSGLGFLVPWLAALGLATWLGGPRAQTWRDAPSWAARIVSAVLLVLAAFVMLVISMGAGFLVDQAGLVDCRPPSDRTMVLEPVEQAPGLAPVDAPLPASPEAAAELQPIE